MCIMLAPNQCVVDFRALGVSSASLSNFHFDGLLPLQENTLRILVGPLIQNA